MHIYQNEGITRIKKCGLEYDDVYPLTTKALKLNCKTRSEEKKNSIWSQQKGVSENKPGFSYLLTENFKFITKCGECISLCRQLKIEIMAVRRNFLVSNSLTICYEDKGLCGM